MVGIEDVAEAVGVSASTVSRALRGLPNVSSHTREKVREAATRLGYVQSMSAAGLVTGRTMAISVVVPSLTQWFYAQAVAGVDSVLQEADYDIALFNLGDRGGRRSRTFRRSLLRHRGDAVLALCVDFSAEEREELRLTGLPTIVVGTPVRGLRRVGIDEEAAGREATEHLLGLGHRDILHLTGGDEAVRGLSPSVPHGRLKGYKNALVAAGIPFDPARVLQGRFSVTVAYQQILSLITSGQSLPTAIFAASDEMAIGAILALKRHGVHVPGDISVIGIDDHDLAACFGLTTLAQHPFDQGAKGATILLEDLRGESAKKKSFIFPVRFIDRGSTAPVSGG